MLCHTYRLDHNRGIRGMAGASIDQSNDGCHVHAALYGDGRAR
jgi:hypothetical protein